MFIIVRNTNEELLFQFREHISVQGRKSWGDGGDVSPPCFDMGG